MSHHDIPLPFQRKWRKLPYIIEDSTPRTHTNIPENVMTEAEDDVTSKWTTSPLGTGLSPLCIKLKNTSVAYAIKFGKCSKQNASSMKEFKVYGGVDKQKMLLLATASISALKNDDESETFSLKYTLATNHEIVYPVLYINICPISSWSTTNHLPSIFYVEIIGDRNPATIRYVTQDYQKFLEQESLRLCFSHLRERRIPHPKIPEPTFVTNLYNACIAGNWDAIDRLLAKNIQSRDTSITWTRLGDSKQEHQGSWPCGRGGHQLVCSDQNQEIYLLGGWNGKINLADFWKYSMATNQWALIDANTSTNGGPSPRSLFKMVMHDPTQKLYVLGGYTDPSTNTPKSDFYMFDSKKWTKFSSDTHADGGPSFVSNLEMCIDHAGNALYVFGGKFQSTYESFYRFDLLNKTWTKLRSDDGPYNGMPLKNRTECCMMYHPDKHQIYIFGGNRGKEPLRDLYVYDIGSDTVLELCRDVGLTGGPCPLNIVKAALDYERDEMYVITGTTRQGTLDNPETLKNEFWIFNLKSNEWTFLHVPEFKSRAAFGITYSVLNKKMFVLGGKEGDNMPVTHRLGDLWCAKISNVSSDEMLRRARFVSLKFKFYEMCYTSSPDSLEPLIFLRDVVGDIVNHQDPTENVNFQELNSFFMVQKCLTGSDGSVDWLHRNRTNMMNELLEFFPDMKSKTNIIDLVVNYEKNTSKSLTD
ncbi:muskelin [Acrasis kona]|uniref:Muskelin n=1 Tax=Acrasis kona TaxID=1008807 RepID=A0AAW2ZNE5_9EUKA